MIPATESRRLAAVLDAAVSFAIAAAIVANAAGSSIQADILHAGRPARWILLCSLAILAFERAIVSRREWRIRRSAGVLLAAFCALSLVSAGWSADVRSTLGRGTGQLLVIASAAALAGCAATRLQLRERLLDGVVGGISVVALASLVYWAATGSPGAYQAASVDYPARFRGIEQNPNTIAMLLAVGMPIALARAFDNARQARARAVYAALLVLLIVEIVLSGSRGGLLAGFVASTVVAALIPGRRLRRAAVTVGALAALVAAAWASTLPQALPASAAQRHSPAPTQRGIDAERVLPLEAEIGSPWWTHRSVSTHRAFFNTSVRGRALRGAIDRALERPLLGWGYGAEIDAFVNRYYGFDSQNPENGYVGLLLQLGVIGLLLFLGAVGACFVAGARSAWREPHSTSAAAVGAATAGLLLGLSQSYFHGPGNIAYVAVWTSLLLASILGLERRPYHVAS